LITKGKEKYPETILCVLQRYEPDNLSKPNVISTVLLSWYLYFDIALNSEKTLG